MLAAAAQPETARRISSVALTPDMRAYVGALAIKAAKSIHYTNIGTVEFLLDLSNNQFYFMEINPRIQVEHAITEAVTGIDLVRAQIRIAAGAPLEMSQQDVQIKGHAIECRINAEDPDNNFLPSPGTGWSPYPHRQWHHRRSVHRTILRFDDCQSHRSRTHTRRCHQNYAACLK